MLTLVLPDTPQFIEIAVIEIFAMTIATEIWLLFGGVKKRRGGKDAT